MCKNLRVTDLKEEVAASSSSRAVMSAAKERKRPVSVGQSEKEDKTRSGRMKALNNEKRNDDEKTSDVGKISVVRNRKSKTPGKLKINLVSSCATKDEGPCVQY